MPPSFGRLFPPANEATRLSQQDVAETVEKQHGRVVRRRLQTTTRLASHSDWPGLAQVCRLVRTTRRQGQETVEVQYAVTSVPRNQADAAQLLTWRRGHWGIENSLHYARDKTFGEDQCRVRTHFAPQILAALRNAAIGLLPSQGCENIASALRKFATQPKKLFTMLGIVKK